MNAITLILPDLHLRHEQAEQIIKYVKPDKIIFLGDYFDDFNDNPDMVKETADWLSWSIHQPNRIYIAGNHDIQYAFANRYFKCSGYEQWKDFIINDIVTNKDWNKLVFYYFLDNKFLLTHAGLHKLHVPNHILDLYKNRDKFYEALDQYLHEEVIKGFHNEGWIFKAGNARGGFQRVGGITWCDTKEFYPIIGLHQIFGHTPQQYGEAVWIKQDSINSKPYNKLHNRTALSLKKINNTDCSYNLCLDVWKDPHYAIWDGETLIVNGYDDDFAHP